MVTVSGPVLNATQSTLGYVTQETRLWAGAADVVRLSELRLGLGGGHKFALRAFVAARPEYLVAFQC